MIVPTVLVRVVGVRTGVRSCVDDDGLGARVVRGGSGAGTGAGVKKETNVDVDVVDVVLVDAEVELF